MGSMLSFREELAEAERGLILRSADTPELGWDTELFVLSGHKDIAECAVIGVADALKGEIPCGFIVLKTGVNRPVAKVEQECIGLIREKIGPVAAFKLAITVARLPKTRSGKILRGTMKKIADGQPWTMPATIDDPVILNEIESALKVRGVGART